MSTATHAEHHDHGHHPTGLLRWLTTTNHKDIGTMYLVFSLLMFFIGGAHGPGDPRRAVPAGPAVRRPAFFNQMTTMHALIMVFGAVMPAFVGLANWMVPLQIGAPDMALPRLNNWSFWILPFAFSLLLMTLFLPGGARPRAGPCTRRWCCRPAARSPS
jgi:cytochrome c oxidase subunit I